MTRLPPRGTQAPMCDCGHDSRQHAPGGRHNSPRPCSVPGCDCSHFRNVAQATKIAKADKR